MRWISTSAACLALASSSAALGQKQALLDLPTTANLRAWHEMMGSEPHVAGTSGDERVVQSLIQTFESFGLEVQRHDFWPLLATPVEAALEIVASPHDAAEPARRGVMSLPLREESLLEDPAAAHPGLSYGWNAYSGSGDVTAEVVYANFGTKEDFAKLRELGVDCAGKIVIARYGRNFRGYKAKYAQEAGAAGLLIYTDPADAGYAKGLTYPEGGWANDSCIQRGSIVTLPYPGDPLTPGTEASEKAPRLDADAIDLPRIPVQPIGWSAAGAIMSKMRGQAVPKLEPSWQGGLPFTYRLEGGPELRVRLMVKQSRTLQKTSNVIARLAGAAHPEQLVIIGCHHDAWGYGAADPLAGTMLLVESARCFGELARRGWRPARTILFAAWGAEEFGIIGSTEWCEANRDMLLNNAVAYINLDMATMGPEFGSSASPSLKQLIAAVTKDVPQAGSPQQRVFDAWARKKSEDAIEGSFGELGGGSDHIAFLCHLAIPSCSLGGGGSEGTNYHSNYDTLAWYRRIVGEDYEPALMLTRLLNLLAMRLADETIIPLDPQRCPADARRHLESLEKLAMEADLAMDAGDLAAAIADCEIAMNVLAERLSALRDWKGLSPDAASRINARLMAIERRWLREEGLPERSWFRNIYAANDPFSGYASWMLPALRWAVDQRDQAAVDHWLAIYAEVFRGLAKLAGDLPDELGRPDDLAKPAAADGSGSSGNQ